MKERVCPLAFNVTYGPVQMVNPEEMTNLSSTRYREKSLEAMQMAMSDGRKRDLSWEQQLAESFTATAAGPVL